MAGFSRALYYGNLISGYNAGRGDLAAMPFDGPFPPAADATGDGEVTIEDFYLLANAWLSAACGTQSGDFDDSGFVQMSDFAELAAAWLIP